MINGKRSQLAMEREAAHKAPFISSVQLRAEMVTGMSWHGQDLVHTSPGESTVSHSFKIWKLEQAQGSINV